MDAKARALDKFVEYKQGLLAQRKIVVSFKVMTRADKTNIKGLLADGTIKIAVAAVRDRGAANQELKNFLAKYFMVDLSQVKIIRGLTSVKKIIKIEL